MSARIVHLPIMKRTAAVHRQAQFLVLLLGSVGVTGTALAIALALAHRLGRFWSA